MIFIRRRNNFHNVMQNMKMPALVLLPGLDGSGLLFAEFTASLAPEVEVITVSYPGDSAAGYSGLETIVRSYLPSNRPFFLLGESFSGPLAISIAASAPPGLLGVVLCCSFARNPLPLLAFARPVASIFPVKTLPLRWLDFLVLGRFSSPALRAALAAALARASPAALRARAMAALAVDVTALLRSITVPILYLCATEDRLIPASSATLIAALASDCRIVEFTAPHFLLQAVPALAAAEISDFMRRNFPG